MYCKHCEEYVSSSSKTHDCKKKGLLDVDDDDSFLVSVIIGAVTGSSDAGEILGGDGLGGMLGDILFGDDDDDGWF